jgi:hypothetical protein
MLYVCSFIVRCGREWERRRVGEREREWEVEGKRKRQRE